MTGNDAPRPSPEALLRQAAQEGRGRLKIFLGAAPGVGKTYEMLAQGAARAGAGVETVIGIVETHGRADTEAMAGRLPRLPRRSLAYEGRVLEEMDLDALLALRPQLALVDELAHSNAPGSRHPKRYQDVEELLAAGIDVYTTVNIQHLESLNDVVASFTHVRVRETVPDAVLEAAEIEVVDIPPGELIERLKAGKVYLPQEATRALSHFFSRSNLSALRELALRRAAQAVDAQMLDHVRALGLGGTWAGGERILVAIGADAGAEMAVRAAKRLADALHAPWTALHVETPRSAGMGEAQHRQLAATLALATQLGAMVATVPAAAVLDGIAAYAREARATQLVLGRPPSALQRLLRALPDLSLHLLPGPPDAASRRWRRIPGSWGSPAGYLWTAAGVGAVTALALALFQGLNLANVALLYLLPVMAGASLFGLRTGLFAGLLSSLAYNFFFLPPTGTLTVADPANLLSIFVLLGVAIATSQLAARVRAQADLAAESARVNAVLAGFLRQLAMLEDAEAVARIAVAEIAQLFAARCVLLVPEADGLVLQAASDPALTLDAMELAAARWAADKGRPAGRGSDTLTACDWYFQPLLAGSRAVAVLGLARDGGDDPVRADRLALLLSLADRTALVLERLRLAREMRALTGRA